MRTEGTECFPVLPLQCRNKLELVFFFSCPTEITSSLEDNVNKKLTYMVLTGTIHLFL